MCVHLYSNRLIKERVWEKDRRDRLNKAFNNLAKLLPQYTETQKNALSKIEILQKSILFVEDLQRQIKELIINNNNAVIRK